MSPNDVCSLILLTFLTVSIPSHSIARAAEEGSLSQEQVELELTERNKSIRAVSNVFAEQQKKTALLKRDRAMFAKDAADPMLSEEDRDKLRVKIAQVETEMSAIEADRIKNRAAFASAVNDYESFAKKNLSADSETI